MIQLMLVELRLLIRNRSVLLLSTAYLTVLALALFLGTYRFYKDHTDIEKLQLQYQTDIQLWKEKVNHKEAGYPAYYLFNPVSLTPSPWSALFSGERSENFILQRVRALAVHGQIHGTPIRNTEHSMLGSLDVGFVWLYLLPVLIGLLSVTFVANDRRLGRWPLLSTLANSKHLIINRLIVRFALVLSLNLIIFLATVFLLPISLDQVTATIFFLLITYQVFWFVIAGLITFFYLNARQSILSFLFVWIVSVWLLPAVHYNSQLDSKAYNTGIELLVNQRQDMNDSWDRDKKADFDAFLIKYPKWKPKLESSNSSDWSWYFAMQKMSDEKVETLAEQYFNYRTNTHSIWLWLSPTLVMQKAFEDLSNTGAKDYQDYLKQTIEWHKTTQDFWFSYVMLNKKINPESLERIPKFIYKPNNDVLRELFALCLFLFMALIIFTITKKTNS
ncbi:DUF3526 domain-containing protein [Aliikangiella sp. IMCC44359]|uniref:DUF3526 domain-containing protein n=1 Tax=Aliikangiella sp. IMCC44359 TaxID=3459125 RepID=UPI00403AB31D